MARNKYNFKCGDLVKSTIGNIFFIQDRGAIPNHNGQFGYKVYNLKSKANYWTPTTDAHNRWKFFEKSKAGHLLYGK